MFSIKLSKPSAPINRGRTKAGLAALLLGLSALVADRLFILPRSAPAGPPFLSSTEDTGAVSAGSIPAAAGAPSAQPPPINARWAQIDVIWSDRKPRQVGARDAFSVPASWDEEPDSGPDWSGLLNADPVSGFGLRHPLKAVVVGVGKNAALVGSNFLAVGQEIDGFKLVAVDQESATFEGGGKRIVLKLANDRQLLSPS